MTEHQLFQKCAWRLIPLMIVLRLVQYLDQVNVGFAALTMNRDLGFSPSVFGFGAGIFFISYALFQLPGSLMLQRLGARRSLFIILMAWGAVSASCALVRTTASFYLLRFLLGVAESGFFPGMIFYLTLWFPKSHRARFLAAFMTAGPLAFILGAPVSSIILQTDGVAGLSGWQWLFLLEGLPASLLAFAVLLLLPDGPAHARWLSPEERALHAASLAADDTNKTRALWPALRDPRVFALGFASGGIVAAMYGYQIWLPQIVQAMGYSIFMTGLLSALPFVVGIVGMVFWGRASDRAGERVWHTVVPALMAASGFVIAAFAPVHGIALAAFGLVTFGIFSANTVCWTLPSSFLSGPAAAGAIGLINTINSLSAFLGSSLMGILKEETGGYAAGMSALAFGLVFSAGIILTLNRSLAPSPEPA
jgi:ACS family tartrate transporter-like MFS transporter